MARPRPLSTQVVFKSWDERNALELWVARPPDNRSWLSLRAQIVLLNADGYRAAEIADHLGITVSTALKWPRRYLDGGIDALRDAARPGVPRSISEDAVDALITATIEERPPKGAIWSTRSMARRMGMSPSSVGRTWRDHGLQPDRLDVFGFSSDPSFLERLRGAALYVKPPEGVLVLVVLAEPTELASVTRDRSDADRAALIADLHEGLTLALGQEIDDEALAKEFERRRDLDLRRFFVRIDQATPEDREVHVILDRSTTRVTKAIHDWLLEHLRCGVYYAPTRVWWLRLVDEWMAILVDRGAARMVGETIAAMDDWMEAFGQDPTPLVCYNGLSLDLSERPEVNKN